MAAVGFHNYPLECEYELVRNSSNPDKSVKTIIDTSDVNYYADSKKVDQVDNNINSVNKKSSLPDHLLNHERSPLTSIDLESNKCVLTEQVFKSWKQSMSRLPLLIDLGFTMLPCRSPFYPASLTEITETLMEDSFPQFQREFAIRQKYEPEMIELSSLSGAPEISCCPRTASHVTYAIIMEATKRLLREENKANFKSILDWLGIASLKSFVMSWLKELKLTTITEKHYGAAAATIQDVKVNSEQKSENSPEESWLKPHSFIEVLAGDCKWQVAKIESIADEIAVIYADSANNPGRASGLQWKIPLGSTRLAPLKSHVQTIQDRVDEPNLLLLNSVRPTYKSLKTSLNIAGVKGPTGASMTGPTGQEFWTDIWGCLPLLIMFAFVAFFLSFLC